MVGETVRFNENAAWNWGVVTRCLCESRWVFVKYLSAPVGGIAHVSELDLSEYDDAGGLISESYARKEGLREVGTGLFISELLKLVFDFLAFRPVAVQ
jgi:hypothetical protein